MEVSAGFRLSCSTRRLAASAATCGCCPCAGDQQESKITTPSTLLFTPFTATPDLLPSQVRHSYKPLTAPSPSSLATAEATPDRKSTRLNSSRTVSSYAVLRLKK